LKKDIESIVDNHCQIDPTLKTQKCFLRITSAYVFKELLLKKGHKLQDFCPSTINNVLNRLGYTLKKVLKTKPLKKIPETDSIFANLNRQHDIAQSNPRILRISIDVKAKVKIGNLSRGGYSRLQEAPKADDHDQHWDATLVPFGIYELNTENVFFVFGQSYETPDFIVDALEKWWSAREFMTNRYEMLMIDLDNGPSVASNTRQFINRMIAFAAKIGMPIQLVYYPPYHSKYNPVERVWAALENYWKPLILDTISNTLKIARRMTWKGMNPIATFIDNIYQKGVKISDNDFKELSPFIERDIELVKWNVKIHNTTSW
jgi:Rhodopirellula transposase DDE domain